MKMDLSKVSRHIRNNPSDVWIPMAASGEILEWMSKQPFATMALFGRRHQVDIDAIVPDKTAATKELTQKLISLGHRKIVLFVREERCHPTPGGAERVFLETLAEHVSIACTDDDPIFEMSHPRVTCIHWPITPVVDNIVRWTRPVSRRRVSRQQKLTEAVVVKGGTIGPVPDFGESAVLR